jgi:ABC-type dipeptide/oligopeptide/nickel transport system permease subunit
MTTTTIVTLPVTKQESLFKRVITNPSGIFSIGIIVAVVLFGIIAPLLSPYNANDPDVYHIQAAPSPIHWFGTDSAGRDIFTRLALATNFSLETAALAVVIAIAIGVVSGLIA